MKVETSSRLVGRKIADHALRVQRDPLAQRGEPGDLALCGDCSSPAYIYLQGRPDLLLNDLDIGPNWSQKHLNAHAWVRCRMCPECLRHRGRLWTARAIDELRLSERTWFGTITLSPQSHHVALAHARRAASQNAVDFDGLSAEEQFQMRHQFIGVELTKWIKRVRKNSGAVIRYLLVVEAHKSGLPHYHCLIHQVNDGVVTARDLRDAWREGFTKFKLVPRDEPKTAFYVCKYLAKSALSRVRASAGYGRGASPHHRKTNVEQPDEVPAVNQTVTQGGNSKRALL